MLYGAKCESKLSRTIDNKGWYRTTEPILATKTVVGYGSDDPSNPQHDVPIKINKVVYDTGKVRQHVEEIQRHKYACDISLLLENMLMTETGLEETYREAKNASEIQIQDTTYEQEAQIKNMNLVDSIQEDYNSLPSEFKRLYSLQDLKNAIATNTPLFFGADNQPPSASPAAQNLAPTEASNGNK